MNIIHDAGLDTIDTILNLKTKYSKECIFGTLNKQSSFPCVSTLLENQKIVQQFKQLNNTTKNDINTIVESIISTEKDLQFFFEEENSLENLEDDTFGQLIFQNTHLKILNNIPFLLLIISYVKIYFIPLVSVSLPILMYFLPYLLIKYVWNMPMPFDVYKSIMGKMMPLSFDGSFEKLLQNGLTLFTFFQSMYQPIQNAFHLYTINSTIFRLGKALENYSNSVEKLQTILKNNSIDFSLKNNLTPFCKLNDYHINFSTILDNRQYLILTCLSVSKFEVLYALANNDRFKKVNIYSSETPYLNITDCVDINLNEKHCVGSHFIIDSTNHFLLSGPNGGGKSSFLRGVLQTVLFSQSFGYAIGTQIEMSPFDFIFSGLHLQDIPGEQSMFEKEICFATDVLHFNNPKYKGFVLFDEIFHSTNPPDSILSANRFLEKLYTYKHMASIISTHVFEIIENAPSYVKRICVNASNENDILVYDYKISNGICKISSVKEIWKKIYASEQESESINSKKNEHTE